MLNLPNFITFIRIVAIPFFLALLSSRHYFDALVVFILVALTDALDGAVARWMKQTTAVGASIDPVADKLLVTSSFIWLGVIDAIPVWLVVLVISRDILILVGYGLIYMLVEERLEVRPTMMGKLSTIFQFVTVGVVLATLADPRWFHSQFDDALFIITAATTVVSGLQYLYKSLLWLQNRGP
jgi:cardiolipin synthase